MSILNKNLIHAGKIQAITLLAILAFGLLITPLPASADYGQNVTFGSPSDHGKSDVPSDQEIILNPKPVIYSISPKTGNRVPAGTTITISGKGFMPASIARLNGANRFTTFIDSSHLLIQADIPDMFQTTDGGFYITVWNPGPGGGFSNAEFFTVNNLVMPNGDQSNNNSYSNTANTGSETFSDLTSNAVYGSGSFLPSGIIQWVMFAIIILLLVILARKLFGGEEHYQATPLKHD